MKTLIQDAVIINEGRSFVGSVLIDGAFVAAVYEEGETPRVDGATVINARASWQINRHVQLFAWVNNLADRVLPIWMHDDRTAGGIFSSMMPPRQIGVGVKAEF